MISPQEGWAASKGDLYRWDGLSWQAYPNEVLSQKLLSLNQFAALAPNDIWAVALNSEHEIEGYGLILHWDGTEWKKMATNRVDLTSIRMFSPTQGWAIGTLGISAVEYRRGIGAKDSVILNWDGKQWTPFPIPLISNAENIYFSNLCGYDMDHLWIFGATRTGDEGHAIALRLVKKKVPTFTATIPPTLPPTITAQPTVYVPTAIITDLRGAGLKGTEELQVNEKRPSGQTIVLVISSLIVGFIILFVQYLRQLWSRGRVRKRVNRA